MLVDMKIIILNVMLKADESPRYNFSARHH